MYTTRLMNGVLVLYYLHDQFIASNLGTSAEPAMVNKVSISVSVWYLL